MILLMAHKLIMEILLEGVEDVIINVEPGVGLPCPKDMNRVFISGVQVKRYLFLLDIKGEALVEHRARVMCGVIFLKHHLYLAPAGWVEWRGHFWEYLQAEVVEYD